VDRSCESGSSACRLRTMVLAAGWGGVAGTSESDQGGPLALTSRDRCDGSVSCRSTIHPHDLRRRPRRTGSRGGGRQGLPKGIPGLAEAPTIRGKASWLRCRARMCTARPAETPPVGSSNLAVARLAADNQPRPSSCRTHGMATVPLWRHRGEVTGMASSMMCHV
jgi:hypothetical protein